MSSSKILLLSPLTPSSGNYFYICRLRSHLQKNGITCCLADPAEFSNGTELTNYLQKENISLVIGIHAYKAGKILPDVPVPYVLVLGGTDVNECTKQPERMDVMTKAITNASHVVGFNKSMLDTFFAHWPCYDKAKTSIISQAVQVSPSSFTIKSYIKNNIILKSPDEKEISHNNGVWSYDLCEDSKLFIMVGGIRPVKNPLFLVKGFSEWRQKKRLNTYFVMIGPQMDASYFKTFQEEISGLPGVIYIPGLSIEDTHAAIRDSFAFVNSSESEGMSLAILEAMCLETPVLARDIAGNRHLVQDDQTGFLFTTVEEFLEKAELLLTKPEIVKKHTQNASEYISKKHSSVEEEQMYMAIINNVLRKNE